MRIENRTNMKNKLTSRENRTCCFNSPLRAITLTNAYSSKPAKTKTRHADIQTSIALIYETRGSCDRIPKYWMNRLDFLSKQFFKKYKQSIKQSKRQTNATICLPELWVVTVSTVKRPTDIRAGTWIYIDIERTRMKNDSMYMNITDLWSIQNETKERITMSIDGI